MGRFRGTKITGDILDNKQQFLHAFAVVREAMAFLDRTLPLSGHFVTGRIQREDRLPVPADALREVILNAVMHRDYSNPGGDISIAVFDDRIEISSYGNLLPGVTPELLSGPHKSILRNPLIAETFHRTGAVETWGRGTNRVIEVCGEHSVEPPVFELQSHCVVVRFPVKVGPTPQVTPQVTPQAAPQVAPQVVAQVFSHVFSHVGLEHSPQVTPKSPPRTSYPRSNPLSVRRSLRFLQRPWSRVISLNFSWPQA
ncbi:MAG: ATP-binding protein [Planctomycetaceae bacterium]